MSELSEKDTTNFVKEIIDEVIDTMLSPQIDLPHSQNQKQKNKQYYIIPVLVDVVPIASETHDKLPQVFVKPYSLVFKSLIRNGNVDRETFFKHAKKATVMDMAEAAINASYYEMIKANGVTLNWEEANAALLVGQHITRCYWQQNHISMAVFQNGDLDHHAPLRIYSNGKAFINTGWNPTEDDKSATDWIIV